MVLFIRVCLFGDIRAWSWRILLNFCWVSIFFDILIINISWMVAQTSINHTIFWKSVVRTFRCMHVNCFNRLRFLAEVNTILQKMHIQEGNMETWQMTPFFIYLFYLEHSVCSIHFYIWKQSKVIFMWSPLGPLWSVKYLNFLATATDSDSPSHFSGK